MGVYERIFAFVLQNFTFGDASGLLPDASLLASGIIDSTGVLELITFIERTFSVKLGDHDLTPENLDSLNRITQFVTRKLAALAPQAQARSA